MKKWSVAVLVVMLAGAFFGWYLTNQYISRKRENSFNIQSDQIKDQIQARVNAYLDALYGADGLFMASRSVTRDEWHAYLSAIKTHDRFPGVHSIYYAERVSADQIDSFIGEVRADKSMNPDGYPGFNIFPVENQVEFFVIKFIEPYEENKAMMGYNLASDEQLKKQLYKARDDHQATAVIMDDSAHETSEKICFLNVPIYSHNQLLFTQQARSDALIGFVGAAMLESDIFADVAKKIVLARGLSYKIRNAPFSERRFDKTLSVRGRFQTQLPLKVADQEWTLDFLATDDFEQGPYQMVFPWAILMLGITCSFLVFMMMSTLQKSRLVALTEVKDINQELSEKAVYLKNMLRHSPDPIVLLDLLGFIKDVNPAAEYISGYPERELLGKHFSQIGLLKGESLAKAMQEFALILSGQNRAPFELELVHRSGRYFYVEAHGSKTMLEKQIPRVQVIFRDVTQRKAAEAKLVQTRDRLDLALRSAQMGVWDWDISTNAITLDRFMGELFGKKEEVLEAGLKGLLEIIHPDDRSRVEQEVQSSLSRGNEFNFEFRVPTKDGKGVLFLTTRGHIYMDERGQARHMIGVCWDITDRKKLQAQLVQSQKMETVGEFSGGIAHDLNNQLTPVLGYLHIIARDLGEDHPLYPLLMEANQSAKRCTEVIQRLMNFSRPTAQKKERVSLKALSEEFKKIVTKFLPATIQFTVRIDEPLPMVIGNENELETVLMNLCSNARDAMPKGGQLSLHIKKIDTLKRRTDGHEGAEGPFACLAITDTGSGMPPEVSQKIFEPFFTTKERGKGTGLGLAMVFNIVKDHGGWIEVVSEVGIGTTFLVYLPGIKGETDTGSISKPSMAKKTGRKWSGTVLFVDDEDYMRKLGKTYLERLGFEVMLASDGVEAVDVYAAHQKIISFVVTDMTMPKQTGRDTIKKILALNAAAKIIVASGFTSEGTPEELKSAGAKDYIQKPYTLAVLEEAIAKIIP